MSNALRYVFSAFFTVFALCGTALAAPQVLAVVAPPDGLEFSCDRAGCKVELTTYCLQRLRDAPSDGQGYRASGPGDFMLMVVDTAGTRRPVPADGILQFTAVRGFMAVEARIRPETLARLDMIGGRLVVGATAALVPEAMPGDRNPLSQAEIADATGPLRHLGQDMVDRSENLSAALVLAAVKQRLPGGTEDGAVSYARLWEDEERAQGRRLPNEAGVARARTAFQECTDPLVAPAHGGVRRCLEWQHDSLIREVNRPFWDLQAGS